MDTEPQEPAKHHKAKDARGVVIGDDNIIYQHLLADDRYRFLTDRLYTFTTLIEEKTKGFVGRQFVFEALDAFLVNHDRGYFIVQGEPGIGKTALIAQLVKTRGYVHHFNDALQGIVRPDQFLQNICVQLIARYQLDRFYSPLEVHYDGGYLVGLLEEVSAKLSESQQAIILVDALDEAERAFDPRANVLYLPSGLPRGIYFVVTRRPVADFPLQVEAPEQTLYLEADSESNLLDVQLYLEGAAKREGIQAQLQAEGMSIEDFVQVLLDKSEGNFMYLHYVVPDIEAGKYPGLKLEELPQGLMGYYERHWRQMRTIDEDTWIIYRQPVICFLAAAKEPISVAQLASFSRLPIPRVQAALRDWREFLDVEEIGNTKKYRIYHTSFQDFLQKKDEVGEVDLTQTHSDIADVLLEQWRRGRQEIGNVYALLIGIAAYHHIRPLAKTTTDAQDLYDTLLQNGYLLDNAALLLDDQATKPAISDKLDWLARRAGPDDTVVIFFSGHGAQLVGGFWPGEYLCPVEAALDKVKETFISAEEFTTALRAIRAGRLVVFLDACHSGGVGEPKDATIQVKAGLSEAAYIRLAEGRGRAVIASCRPDEVSWELSDMRNGLFTHYLLEGLRGAAADADGSVGILDLFKYVSQQVPQKKPQHPLFKGEIEVNFAITVGVTPPAASVPPTPPPEKLAAPAVEIDPDSVNPTKLRQAMHSAYDRPAFEILCKDLGLDYHDLRGETLETKMLYLIDWHRRRHRYADLVRKVLEDHPYLAQELQE